MNRNLCKAFDNIEEFPWFFLILFNINSWVSHLLCKTNNFTKVPETFKALTPKLTLTNWCSINTKVNAVKLF